MWKSIGKCLETTLFEVIVFGEKCICSRVPDCSPPPCMGCDIAVATKEEVEVEIDGGGRTGGQHPTT